MKEIILSSIAVALIVNAIAPVFLFFLSKSVAYWTRKRNKPTYAFNFIMFKYKRFLNEHDLDNTDAVLAYILGDFCSLMVFAVIADLLMKATDLQITVAAIVVGVVIAFFFLPRFIVDINHSLKMKNGDSERIKKLEHELSKLKGK